MSDVSQFHGESREVSFKQKRSGDQSSAAVSVRFGSKAEVKSFTSMSALPPKRTFAVQQPMSAMGHKRTFRGEQVWRGFRCPHTVGVVSGNVDKPKVKHAYQELWHGQSRTTESDERARVRQGPRQRTTAPQYDGTNIRL